jgi:hypothetical protein
MKEKIIGILIIGIAIISAFSGCVDTNDEGFASLVDISYQENFTSGEQLQVDITVLNLGNNSVIYADLKNVDTDEYIQQLETPFMIAKGSTYDFTFSFVLSQSTDFNGEVNCRHKEDIIDTRADVFIDCADLYENIGNYQHLTDTQNYLTIEDLYKININDLPRGSMAKFVKPMTLGAFDLRFSFNLSRLDYGGSGSGWASTVYVTLSQSETISRGNYDMLSSPNNQSLSFYIEAYTSTTQQGRIAILRDWRIPWGQSGCYEQYWFPEGMCLGVTYDVHMYRLADAVYLDMYNGPSLVWATSMPNIPIQYDYFYPLMGVGIAFNPEVYAAGWFKNYAFASQ